MSQISKSPPPARQLNPALSPAIGDALEKCLAKAPNRRFQTATAFVEAISAGVPEAAPTALRPSRWLLGLCLLPLAAGALGSLVLVSYILTHLTTDPSLSFDLPFTLLTIAATGALGVALVGLWRGRGPGPRLLVEGMLVFGLGYWFVIAGNFLALQFTHPYPGTNPWFDVLPFAIFFGALAAVDVAALVALRRRLEWGRILASMVAGIVGLTIICLPISALAVGLIWARPKAAN
jgi:hypothetical protein